MNQQPLISIITVCFNSASTIKDTIDSVLFQTYSNFEHLVIDGMSTDKTMKLVLSYHHSNLIVTSEPDKGIYDAMNKGLSIATGDVIGFLNSDDFYADSFVLDKVTKAFKDPSIDVCYGDLVYITQDNNRVVRYWKSKEFLAGDFAKGWSPAHPTFFVRKSKLAELGLFDISYKLAADVEFMMRYLERGHLKSVYIPNVLVRMRIGGVSNKNFGNILKQNKEVIAALRKNNLPFSFFLFFVNKLFNRINQYVTARFK